MPHPPASASPTAAASAPCVSPVRDGRRASALFGKRSHAMLERQEHQPEPCCNAGIRRAPRAGSMTLRQRPRRGVPAASSDDTADVLREIHTSVECMTEQVAMVARQLHQLQQLVATTLMQDRCKRRCVRRVMNMDDAR